MYDSKKELLGKVELGESTFLELKEVRFVGSRISSPTRDSLADELAAFANGSGGVCLLGVEDTSREILGIPVDNLPAVESFIREICNDSITPPIIPVIDFVRLPTATGEDVPVVKVDISRSLFVHQSPGGYLYRIGSSKRRISPEYLARLLQQRSQSRIIAFDEQPVSNASLGDLAPELYNQFRTSRTDDSTNWLSKLHMTAEDESGELRPTVAGVLMASQDPRAWMPNAFIQAVAYRGTEINPGKSPYQLDAADIVGPLDRQIDEACHFVAKNMRVAAFKYMGRIDRPQYDMAAVFEAIVNAVAHRDYSIYSSKIRLRMFENRLEIYSPGSIPNAMTIESLAHVQSARNDIVTSLLAKCPVPDRPWLTTDRRTMMDRRGEGVPVILTNSERLSGRTPEYRLFDEAQLMLTIYAPED